MKQSQYKTYDRYKFYEEKIMILEDDIYAFLISRVKNDQDASDLRQSTMEKAWKHLDQLRDPNKARSWLFQIANREMTAFLKKQRRRWKREFNYEFDEQTRLNLENLEDNEQSALEMLINDFEGQKALEALQLMEPEEQNLISLRFLDGFMPAEIAEFCGEKPSTIRSRLSRCLDKYRNIYKNLERGR